MRVLIDGDVLRYRAGFTAERMRYRLVDRYSDDNVIVLNATKFTDVKEELKVYNKDKWRLEKYKEVDPVEFALQNCKRIINHIQWHCGAQSGETEIYLTAGGDHNFRCKVAKTRPYKGNRMFQYYIPGGGMGEALFYLKAKTVEEAKEELAAMGITGNQFKKEWLKIPPGRPVHYAALTQYLLERWNAEEVTGYEVDDKLAMIMTEDENSICCSIDKDLLQVPGTHFNFVTEEFTLVRKNMAGMLTLDNKKLTGTGFAWFCAQMLLGDSADHIQGLPGYGPSKVFKTIMASPDNYDITCEAALIKKVQQEYKKVYKEKAKDRFFENAQLLWLKRSEDDDICQRLSVLL